MARGERLGDGLNLQRWQIIRKIGEGQFAEVYEVADTFHEGRRVALKMDRTLDVKTVRQEHKVLKRLQACPTVVRLLEQGTHEDRGFIVMEVRSLLGAPGWVFCITPSPSPQAHHPADIIVTSIRSSGSYLAGDRGRYIQQQEQQLRILQGRLTMT